MLLRKAFLNLTYKILEIESATFSEVQHELRCVGFNFSLNAVSIS